MKARQVRILLRPGTGALRCVAARKMFRRGSRGSATELVVILVAADPNPREFIRRGKISDNAIMIANACGIEILMEWFELNRWMPRIFQPEPIIFESQLLNVLW